MNTQVIISFEEVSKRFGPIEALRKVSFQVCRGDVFGYLGPNGAGKTTTIRIILGLLIPNEGKATVLGNDSTNLLLNTKKEIGTVLETDGLYPDLSAEENLTFYGRVYSIQDISLRIKEVLDFVGLYNRRKDPVKKYSRGMKRRLAIARAMMVRPSILIFDEPTTGLDPEQQGHIQQMIKKVATEENVTIFLSSHNLNEVQEVCDKIGIVNNGRLLVTGGIDELAKVDRKLQVRFAFPSHDNLSRAEKILLRLGYSTIKVEQQEISVQLSDEAEIHSIVKKFIDNNVHVTEIRKQYPSIEDLYFKYVTRGGKGG